MKYMPSFARLPKYPEMLNRINSSASSLHNKLESLDIKSLPISLNMKNSVSKKLENSLGALQLSSFLLSWSLANPAFNLDSPEKFTLIDYGGGYGLISMLAKELNLTVLYIDIDKAVVHDAKTIADVIGNRADYYLQGDIDILISFLDDNNIVADAITSYDVIEHIHDVESFFQKLPHISTNPLTIANASGANIRNMRIARRLMKKHHRAEHLERESDEGGPRDCNLPFLNVRKEIISKYTDRLTEQEIDRLSTNTRGMIVAEIHKSVDTYLNTGELVKELNHPTNTCDPYTGNWCEHLFDPEVLSGILAEKGYNAEIKYGYYGPQTNPVLKAIAHMLNICINLVGNSAMRIAPFYMVYARSNKKP